MAKSIAVAPPPALVAQPCLSAAAARFLQHLATGKRVGEYGAGGSTLWLSGCASSVISIEDDARWYAVVTAALAACDNATVRLVERAAIPDGLTVDDAPFDVIYADPLHQRERYLSIVAAAPLLSPGGWLVADDYDFPNVKRAVDELAAQGWDVALVSGRKLHPVRRVIITTVTAFCRKADNDCL